MSLIRFSGPEFLRQRLVLSILSGKAVRIDNIRSDDRDPGLRGVSSLWPLLALVFNVLIFFYRLRSQSATPPGENDKWHSDRDIIYRSVIRLFPSTRSLC